MDYNSYFFKNRSIMLKKSQTTLNYVRMRHITKILKEHCRASGWLFDNGIKSVIFRLRYLFFNWLL